MHTDGTNACKANAKAGGGDFFYFSLFCFCFGKVVAPRDRGLTHHGNATAPP